MSGLLGSGTQLSGLIVSSGDAVLTGIGLTGAAGVTGTVSVTSSAAIRLNGADYVSGGAQTWTAASGVRYRGVANAAWTAGGAGISLPATDLYVDHAGFTLALGCNLSARNLYFYRGNLNIAGRTITTSADLAVFGAGYNPDDNDYGAAADDTRFAYEPASTLAYLPNGEAYNASTGLATTAPSAAFANLNGSTLGVGGNFYVNGAALPATAAWTLTIPDNAASNPQFNTGAAVTANQWGLPYAVLLNSTVAYCQPSFPVSAAAIEGAEFNNRVADSGNNHANVVFRRPQIGVASTIYDDVVMITMHDNLGAAMLIENSAGEITTALETVAASAAVGGIWYNSGSPIQFLGVYADPACTTPLANADASVFYLRIDSGTDADRWNTDATGSSAGPALSMDRGRPGVAPAHRTTIPDLSMLKGLLYAATGKTMARGYNTNGAAVYDATIDDCRPVLVAVETGTTAHQANTHLPTRTDDAHHYMQLRWSEPVDIGTDAAFLIGAGAPAANVRSSDDFAGNAFTTAANPGGQLSGSSAIGYFSAAAGTVTAASRNAGDATNDAVHALFRAAPYNAHGVHGLFISAAGWSFANAIARFWPGYLDDAVTPSGVLTVPYHVSIVDDEGNAIESTANTEQPVSYGSGYAKATISVTGATWESAREDATYELTKLFDAVTPGVYDIVPVDSPVQDSYIDRLEVRTTRSTRDSSLSYPALDVSTLTTVTPAFAFKAASEASYSAGGPFLETNVIAGAWGGSVNVSNDRYFAIRRAVVNTAWTIRSQLSFTYTEDLGYVTDIHGIRLRSVTGICIELSPPSIRFTTGVVGGTDLYVILSKGIFGTGALSVPVPADFVATGLGGVGIDDVQVLSTSGSGAYELMLTLDTEISAAFALDATLGLTNAVTDSLGNTASNAADHKALDLAQTATASGAFVGGLLNVLGASDGIHTGDETTTTDALAAGALGLLRTFDGTGRLYDRDVTMFTAMDLTGGASSALSLQMYYDVNPPANAGADFAITGRSALLGTFWLPSIQAGFNLSGNTAARALSPFYIGAGGLSRNFSVPGSDSEIASGASVGFLFRYGTLWIARATDIGDPRQFDLWRYKVQDVVQQRGGVSIMNNVIDSAKRERVALQLDLAEAGQVTVLVFTLDGDVVKSLHRGRMAAGVYTLTWDGSNAGGNPVARGMYFIRVVGPGIDEIRKVMVVKN